MYVGALHCKHVVNQRAPERVIFFGALAKRNTCVFENKHARVDLEVQCSRPYPSPTCRELTNVHYGSNLESAFDSRSAYMLVQNSNGPHLVNISSMYDVVKRAPGAALNLMTIASTTPLKRAAMLAKVVGGTVLCSLPDNTHFATSTYTIGTESFGVYVFFFFGRMFHASIVWHPSSYYCPAFHTVLVLCFCQQLLCVDMRFTSAERPWRCCGTQLLNLC